MKKLKILFAVTATFILASFSYKISSPKKSTAYRIAFYNTENFFDTINDLDVQDEEFTPAGKNQWTSVRYQTKVEHLAKVVAAIAPDFIGLAEIENKNVLIDLVNNVQLLPYNYQIIHVNSPDVRGIDVAFLYQKNKITITGYHTLKVLMPDDTAFRTRDILQVEGVMPNKDSVCFFVNHWPSRRGGTDESEPRRLRAATVLRTAVNQYCMAHPKNNVIIMGDFNDDPNNKSLQFMLQADTILASMRNSDLFSPMFLIYARTHSGSLYYKNAQDMFDQIIISNSLVEKNGGKENVCSSASVFKPDWYFKVNKYKENGPWRTYEGTDYTGGYSDHCPVYINLKL